MSAWNWRPDPVPIEAQRVALAAASEQTDRIVVEPGTDSIVLRRPVVWSIAQGNPYVAPWESAEFVEEPRKLLAGIVNLVDIAVAPGDPTATGDGPDVTLILGLIEGSRHRTGPNPRNRRAGARLGQRIVRQSDRLALAHTEQTHY